MPNQPVADGGVMLGVSGALYCIELETHIARGF